MSRIQYAGAYHKCSFCGGNGCIACYGERQKDFAEAQRPIFTAKLDSEADMKLAEGVMGKDVLDKAFGPGGGGVAEIERNAAIASFIQYVRGAVTVGQEQKEGGEHGA